MQGIPPVPERPTSWQVFLRAHWSAIAGADFFTTEVCTWRGLVTYYTVFVIDLASRRVQIVGSTPSPNLLFMRQVGRTLTAASCESLQEVAMLFVVPARAGVGLHARKFHLRIAGHRAGLVRRWIVHRTAASGLVWSLVSLPQLQPGVAHPSRLRVPPRANFLIETLCRRSLSADCRD